MRLVKLSLTVALLCLGFCSVSLAQGPWHGYKHAQQGVNWGTAYNQTVNMVTGQGQTYAASNGNWLHYQVQEGHRVGSLIVYDAYGSPVTQFPKGVNNFGNNVANGRCTEAPIPTGAQFNAVVSTAVGATSGTTFCPVLTINPYWYHERQFSQGPTYTQ